MSHDLQRVSALGGANPLAPAAPLAPLAPPLHSLHSPCTLPVPLINSFRSYRASGEWSEWSEWREWREWRERREWREWRARASGASGADDFNSPPRAGAMDLQLVGLGSGPAHLHYAAGVQLWVYVAAGKPPPALPSKTLLSMTMGTSL